jgi:hypothetical protein
VRTATRATAAGCDPASGLPYFLSVAVGRNVLWARNVAHLDLIEAYLAANLRDRQLNRTQMSLMERLPAWIKTGKNRRQLIAVIGRLRRAAMAS